MKTTNGSKMMKSFAAVLLAVLTALTAITASMAEEADSAAADTGSEMASYGIEQLRSALAGMTAADIEANVNVFSDMEKHWSRQVVGKLAGLDIIAGDNGRFMPEASVQADQFIKMALRSLGFKIEENTDGYWAQPYIDMALSEGLVQKGEIADYQKPLAREQMAVIIVRTAVKTEERPDNKYEQYIIGKVADYNQVSNDMKQDVLDAYKTGLVEGDSGKFNPKEEMSRAEAAAVIVRILDKTERRPMAPGADEVIKLVDNLSNPMEIYPGTIREYFEIEKVMQKALPKAKGYAPFFYNPDGGEVVTGMYKSYEAWQKDCITKIASFYSYNVYKDPDNPFAYVLCVWQRDEYKELFAEYTRELLKALYGKDAQKAIALHDKYLNIKTDKPDGSNYYETTRLNNRYTEFVGSTRGFTMFVKLCGEE